ncbi:alpha-amylase family glycosyl hydrolase [Flavobacterium frigidarium]|uniref:alpha-amylase family glycosyl hydrolase n=1 Tax=Flavobacterium frigidarium TaxID=99286 RepID=UPI00040005C6|nr:alpha-amylase family glycosyl hydrolase [Flavobacterium frigidarium]
MKKQNTYVLLFALAFLASCSSSKMVSTTKKETKTPFIWEAASVYFLMTDRFNNGDTANDQNYNRTKTSGKLRGFQGGDIKGISQKIDEGYFDKLGINAIWFTPIVEQIHDGVDEGTGYSYAFHGYWTRDWTALDPNFGTKDDLAALVEKAHAHGIRIILDGVINHTGPVTPEDSVWPQDWVRTDPECDYKTFETTTACTLVKNLPDIKTESNQEVALPPFLIQKWKAEGRYEKEVASLDAFFKRTGYPRTSKNYIIKWLTDYIVTYGIDGYRADTVKHTNLSVWSDFKTQCDYAFATWKKNNPTKVLDNNPFYTISEVYNYNISAGKYFDFGDKKVNYYDNGFSNMINFEFKSDALKGYEFIFSKYSNALNGELKGHSVLNYLSSHDDGSPFDANRTKNKETATKLLLSPGLAQVFYGDESARSLVVEGTEGDATLRSFMNWEDIKSDKATQEALLHWQKLGQFRKNHPSIGAGVHQEITAQPYTFSRTFYNDKYTDQVVVGLNLPIGKKELSVGSIFANGITLIDAYSGKLVTVTDGKVSLDTPFDIALLEKQ